MASDDTTIKLEFKGKLLTDTLGTTQIFHDEYLNGFENSLKTLRDYIRARCPIGVSGRLRSSVNYRAEELTPRGRFGFPTGPLEFEGEVYARSEAEYHFGIFPTPWSAICPYSRAVEIGTRPHFPPMILLRDWASRVLFLARPAATLAAYFIGRSISKHGTRGRFMFRDGLTQFESEKVFENNMEKAVAIATQKTAVETPWWAAF